MYDKEIQEILDKLLVFDKLYDKFRLVDPVAKRIIIYKDKSISELDMKCFEFWEKGKVCDNCISMRAFIENKTFYKMEYTLDKIFMVTALPFDFKENRIVIELMTDVTDSMFIDSGGKNKNAKIYELVDAINHKTLKDSLTGVYNRRYINEKLPIDLINMEYTHQDISIIMVDMDNFKEVNDTLGHLAGDIVVKSFADVLTTCIDKENDWVSRFGGDEFMICLPGTSLMKAVEIAENIRLNVEKQEIIYRDNIIKITASFGVSSMRPEKGSSMEALIECADQKLYEAKHKGSNRVEYLEM